jgi:hypothetical protein
MITAPDNGHEMRAAPLGQKRMELCERLVGDAVIRADRFRLRRDRRKAETWKAKSSSSAVAFVASARRVKVVIRSSVGSP